MARWAGPGHTWGFGSTASLTNIDVGCSNCTATKQSPTDHCLLMTRTYLAIACSVHRTNARTNCPLISRIREFSGKESFCNAGPGLYRTQMIVLRRHSILSNRVVVGYKIADQWTYAWRQRMVFQRNSRVISDRVSLFYAQCTLYCALNGYIDMGFAMPRLSRTRSCGTSRARFSWMFPS